MQFGVLYFGIPSNFSSLKVVIHSVTLTQNNIATVVLRKSSYSTILFTCYQLMLLSSSVIPLPTIAQVPSAASFSKASCCFGGDCLKFNFQMHVMSSVCGSGDHLSFTVESGRGFFVMSFSKCLLM